MKTFVLSCCSLICEELDRPRPGEEKEKLEDAKEKADEKDAIEKRKSRGAGGKKNAKIYLKLLPKIHLDGT